ncbi:hypothetical protein BHM03_00017964 [Ensete ventricosum]|nr:hypothetical protein BHM03_00017964 [Ensete ventricosum]
MDEEFGKNCSCLQSTRKRRPPCILLSSFVAFSNPCRHREGNHDNNSLLHRGSGSPLDTVSVAHLLLPVSLCSCVLVQRLLDASHRDLRRARAAALNIVPTSTGAAKAVSLVLPQLKGKLNGIALRVPTPNVSVVDLVVNVEKKGMAAEDVNNAFRKAAQGPLKGILAVCDVPLVSVDFRCSDVSSTIDSSLTMVMGDDMVKVVAWYDNEWGYR